jgi:coproporphyrinogen III oxidase-like Fe-S oxidoreductase
MLGLRLDEDLPLAHVAGAVDGRALERLSRLGLVTVSARGLRLTARGRFLGGAVTAELMV